MRKSQQMNTAKLIADWAEDTRLTPDEKERIRRNIDRRKTAPQLEWLPCLYEHMDFFLRLNQDMMLKQRFS
jgi:hypothetical protein